jgi:uncharacterized protein YcbK (DUF882 family)
MITLPSHCGHCGAPHRTFDGQGDEGDNFIVIARHATLICVLLAASAAAKVDLWSGSDSSAPHPRKHTNRKPPDESRKEWSAPGILPTLPTRTRYQATLFNTHTQEILPATDETPQPELQHFLRCRVTGLVHPMSRVPFEVALNLADHFGVQRIEIISGYRSEKFNELLRKKGHQVAARSQHIEGNALDFRIPGIPAAEVARAAAKVHRGGIGTYRESDFVHVDVGRNRRWSGR